jgi:DEAD/DEAH box helicase domain-containing protein
VQPDDLGGVLERLATRGQLVHLETIPARPPRYGALERALPDAVASRLPGLWSHQAAAIDLARAGRSVAVATGTASGKSLCYLVPIAAAAVEDPGSTALLVFPTKALAHDQLRAIGTLDVPGLTAATYDGDADPDERMWARRNAGTILTNPDMLHFGILPNHERWANFLMRLRYVVFDELHMLRGLFGTHVAQLVRRLRRLCAVYGAQPTFVFTSATIGEPAQLASALCGLDVAGVVADGSPRGERLFALWNPPFVAPGAGIRASANGETAALLATLVAAGHRTIAFTRSRKGTELVAAAAKAHLPEALGSTIRPYRGGYLARERREIERQLFAGELRGLAATSALELGVDIGGLDACILNGFPGTVASMWQQAGRAGRALQRSLAVLVAGADALDQWLMAHPKELFARPPEVAVINPSNPYVLSAHVACAAYERPLTPDDDTWWAPPYCDEDALDEGIRRLVLDDRLRLREGRAVYAGRGRPAFGVGLRTGSRREVQIVDSEGNLIGTVDEARAFESVHAGAVYLHQGQHYRVEELDIEEAAAWVVPVDPEELTQAKSDTGVRILEEDEAVAVGSLRLALGTVEITQQVTGYRRTALSTGERLGEVALDLPPTMLHTRAFWYTVEPDDLDAAGVGVRRVPGTLHAAEHAAIGMLPLFTICDRWDVGGVSTPHSPDTGRPTIVIYDGYPGGAGVAELGYAAGDRHLAATLEAIEACPCEGGCPSCVQSPKCGNLNEPLDKPGAIAFLRRNLRQ